MDQWGVGYIERDDEGPAFVVERSVEDAEVRAVADADDTLKRWVLEAPYADLFRERESFFRAAEAAALAGPGASAAPLQSALSSWLSKFRAFDDHLSRLISQEYGKESTAYAAWKKSLSDEYDGCFAYRFCVKLRNLAQHAQQPIQRMQVTHGGLADGRREVSLTLEFDPPTLLRAYDGWGRAVQRDLEARGEQGIDVLATLLSAQRSCQRVMAKLVVREAARINRACDTIDAFLSTAATPGRTPAFIRTGDFGEPTMELSVMEIPLADSARARSLLREAPSEV